MEIIMDRHHYVLLLQSLKDSLEQADADDVEAIRAEYDAVLDWPPAQIEEYCAVQRAVVSDPEDDIPF